MKAMDPSTRCLFLFYDGNFFDLLIPTWEAYTLDISSLQGGYQTTQNERHDYTAHAPIFREQPVHAHSSYFTTSSVCTKLESLRDKPLDDKTVTGTFWYVKSPTFPDFGRRFPSNYLHFLQPLATLLIANTLYTAVDEYNRSQKRKRRRHDVDDFDEVYKRMLASDDERRRNLRGYVNNIMAVYKHSTSGTELTDKQVMNALLTYSPFHLAPKADYPLSTTWKESYSPRFWTLMKALDEKFNVRLYVLQKEGGAYILRGPPPTRYHFRHHKIDKTKPKRCLILIKRLKGKQEDQRKYDVLFLRQH